MATIEYLDFDLRIQSSPGGYRTQALSAPAGEASDEFVLPFSEQEIEIFLLKVGRPSRGTRRMESQEMAAAKAFGGKLFRAAFGGNVYGCFRSSLEQAVQQNKGLRLRLRLTDAPKLADLPWEYLYHPDFNRFFGLSIETPIIRYIELPLQIKPLAVRPPLRLLVMIASPTDYPALDTEGEWRKLQDALAGPIRQQAVQLERLAPATLPALREKLRTNGYHVFHFIGHGAFDQSVQDGLLLIEDRFGKGKAITGQSLGAILHDERTLRLAVLNACEGARAAQTDPFAGVAQSLIQQEIPAVIAMQFPITDDAAAAFSRELYAAIAAGMPVDAATAEARKAILTDVSDVEWGTPVLYLRAADGRIFDIAGQMAPPPPLPQDQETAQHLAELYDQALGAYYTDQWPQAIALFNEIVALQPGYEDAANKLADATRQQILLDNYATGQQAHQSATWVEAIQRLEAVVAIAPAYRDAAALLAEARQQRDLAEMYTEAWRMFRAGNWPAVLKVGERITATAPAYPDPDGLFATARARLAAEEKERQATTAYREGLRHLDAKRWAEAVAAFERAEGFIPGYGKVAAPLALARKALADQKAAEELEARAGARYDQAAEALSTGQWERAISHLEQLVQAAPGYRDAKRLLAQARQELTARQAADARQSQVRSAYSRANQALAARDWDTAIALLAQVQELEPGYRDVARKLADAREQQALAERFSKAMTHMGAKRWAEAISALRDIVAQAPDYADPVYGSAVGMLTQALQQKERAELPPPPARRDRPPPSAEEPKPRGKPTNIPR